MDAAAKIILGATVINAISVVALAIITFWYARQTKRIASRTADLADQTKRMADETAHLAAVSQQAWLTTVFPRVELKRGSITSGGATTPVKTDLTVKNSGDFPFTLVSVRVETVAGDKFEPEIKGEFLRNQDRKFPIELPSSFLNKQFWLKVAVKDVAGCEHVFRAD